MQVKNKKIWCGILLVGIFAVWTVLVRSVNVQPIGPMGSSVGFAEWNRLFHSLTGVHMRLYTITDWLGLVPVAVGMGFAGLGLIQWCRRRRILLVDYSILLLGVFYILVTVCYLLFETVVINYRPVLINNRLEASYPSSTTLLVLCVMPSAVIQLRERIKNESLRTIVISCIYVFDILMVMGRLLSGVHWLTDIVGGAVLSAGMVKLYGGVCEMVKKSK